MKEVKWKSCFSAGDVQSTKAKTSINTDKCESVRICNNKIMLSSVKNRPLGSSKIRTSASKKHQPHHIICLIENRAKEVGMCTFNLNSYKIELITYRDTQNYCNTLSLVTRYNPIEVLLCESHADNYLAEKLALEFNDIQIAYLKRKLFDDTRGMIIYRSSLNPKLPAALDCYYVALSCLAALIDHIEEKMISKLNLASLDIQITSPTDYVVLDRETMIELELVVGGNGNKPLSHLFECVTLGGERMMRMNLLQPLRNLYLIQERQNSILELLSNPETLSKIRNVLEKFKYCENIVSKFSHRYTEYDEKLLKTLLTSIIQLYQFLQACSILSVFLEKFSSPLLRKIYEDVNNLSIAELIKMFETYFNFEDDNFMESKNFCENFGSQKHAESGEQKMHAQNSKNNIFSKETIYFVLKQEVNSIIKLARISYTRSMSNLYDLLEAFKIKLENTDIKINESEKRSFFFSVPRCLFDKNDNYENIEKNILSEKILHFNYGKTRAFFTTPTLQSLSHKVEQSRREIIIQTECAVRNILSIIQQNLKGVIGLVESISFLDFLGAEAIFAVKSAPNICKPIFINDHAILMEGVCLPSLKIINSRDKSHQTQYHQSFFFSPLNKLVVLIQNNNEEIVSDLKILAQCQILIQIGCLIPAQNIIVHIQDCILTKLRCNDRIEEQQSCLSSELLRINSILSMAEQEKNTDNLILLKNVVSSTSSKENLSYSYAILNYLLTLGNSQIVAGSVDENISKITKLFKNVEIGIMVSENNFRLIKNIPKGHYSSDTEHRFESFPDFNALLKDFKKEINKRYLDNSLEIRIEEYLVIVRGFYKNKLLIVHSSTEEKEQKLNELKKMYFKKQ